MIVKFHPTADPAGSTLRFYDSDWGYFHVVKADLERAFGTSDLGENDLKIVDPMGTATLRSSGMAWKATLENLSINFLVRAGRECRFVSIFYDGMPEAGGRQITHVYVGKLSEWDELLRGFRSNMKVFRRNLGEALRR